MWHYWLLNMDPRGNVPPQRWNRGFKDKGAGLQPPNMTHTVPHHRDDQTGAIILQFSSHHCVIWGKCSPKPTGGRSVYLCHNSVPSHVQGNL